MDDAQPEKLSRWFLGRLFLAVLFDNLFDVRAKQAIRDYHQRIKGNTPGVGVPGVVFCGCDDHRYKAFASAFLLSAEALDRPLHVHLHLYGPSQETLDHIDEMRRALSQVRLTFTWEDEAHPASPIYASAARYLVLHHLLSACRAPVLCLGIDGVMHRSPTEIFDSLRRGDVMLRFRPDVHRFGRRVLAGAVGVGHTREALGFTKKLAAGLWKGLRMRPRSRIDQFVLSYLYEIRSRLRPRLRWQPVPAQLFGGLDNDRAVWTAATPRLGYDVMPARGGVSVPGYGRAIEDLYVDRALGDGTHG
ncbi:hypothetical protein KXR53_25845 [Inquilinus limosus]|uniref:hypothetical protein n=1 Tax=Inquilinus limosus TaxID=171674 RepID=UPI003F170A81